MKSKADALGEPDNDDSSAADALDSKTRELKSLNNSIATLSKKALGKLPFQLVPNKTADIFGSYGERV